MVDYFMSKRANRENQIWVINNAAWTQWLVLPHDLPLPKAQQFPLKLDDSFM